MLDCLHVLCLWVFYLFSDNLLSGLQESVLCSWLHCLVFWDRQTWESIWFGNFQSPIFFTQNLQLHEADTRGWRKEQPNLSDQGWQARTGLGVELENWSTWFRDNGELRGLSWKIVWKFPALSIPFLSQNFCTILCGWFWLIWLDSSAVLFCWVLVPDLFFLLLCFSWRNTDNLGSNVDALIVDVPVC